MTLLIHILASFGKNIASVKSCGVEASRASAKARLAGRKRVGPCRFDDSLSKVPPNVATLPTGSAVLQRRAHQENQMSINPLHTIMPAPVIPERQPENRSGTSSFGKLLDRLQSGTDGSRSEQGQVAAELLRIEMMRSSLSLADDGETPRPAGSPVLATLLARLAENGRLPCETGTAPSSAEAIAATGDPPVTGSGDIIRTASRFLGTPYLFGGEGPAGIDCSSLVQQVFREHRISLPRTAMEQSKVGKEVAEGELREGDLLFFHTYASYPSHVGIYLGDGKMIHASSGSGKVAVSDINSDYYQSRFIGAKRVS